MIQHMYDESNRRSVVSIILSPYPMPDDDVYFSDTGNFCIRKVTVSTGMTADVAGVCTVSGYVDGVTAASAKFGPSGPKGLLFRGSDLFIAGVEEGVKRSYTP